VGSAAPDISVVIPYYNRELYIDQAVKSVLSQTLKPLEILIVNDASRESSRRFLDQYASVCTIIDLPVNVGLAGSRNAGIRAARGRFIALLDDDDIWLPRKLEVQRQYLEEHPECAGVHSAVWLMSPQQADTFYRRFGTWWEPSSEATGWRAEGEPPAGPLTLAHALTNDYWVIPSTMMFRTEVVNALGGFDPHFRQCEDRDFIIRFCAAGYRIGGIHEPLVKLRREGHSNLTGRRWRIFRSDLRMCWKHRRLYLQAYGPRGIAVFILDKLLEPTAGLAGVHGGLNRLHWLLKVKFGIKPSYKEPVICESPIVCGAPPVPAALGPIPKIEMNRRQVTVDAPTADITVIIPFYNREIYIDEAVQSVLAQSLKPMEIIIVNDCSKESARRYLDRYANVCKILDLPKNVGLAGARNAAIRVARGKFIALLDDDDSWVPEKLEIQHRYLQEHPECTGVHSAVWMMSADLPNECYKKFEPGPLPLSVALTHSQWVIPSTLLIRTEAVRAVGNFDPWFRENEDRDFVVRCCAAGYRLEGIDEPLVYFRRTGHDHLAGKHLTMYKSHVKLCWKHRSLYYRTYGWKGAPNFLLQSTYLVVGGYIYDTRKTLKSQILQGIMWRVHQLKRVKFELRADYQDPVSGESGITRPNRIEQDESRPMAQASK